MFFESSSAYPVAQKRPRVRGIRTGWEPGPSQRPSSAFSVSRSSAGGQSMMMNVVVVLDLLENFLQLIFPVLRRDQLDGRPHKILVRRDEIQTIDLSFEYDFFERLAED